MTPKEIEYFIAVAEELNFRMAAERLHISQPPLTRHIKNLEENLGVLLFNRDNKKVKLTFEGKAFFKKAKEFINHFEDLKDTIKLSNSSSEGILKIDFTFFGISKKLPKVIESFKKKYPKIDLIINETAGTYNLKESVLNDKTDIAISYGMKKDSRFNNIVIESDQVVYAIPGNHKFCNLDEIKLEQAFEEKFVFFPRHVDPFWYDHFQGLCFERGFSPQIVQHIESMWKKINLVSLNIGITLTGSNFIKYNIPNVTYKHPVDSEKIELPIVVSYKVENDNPALKKFIEILTLKN